MQADTQTDTAVGSAWEWVKMLSLNLKWL